MTYLLQHLHKESFYGWYVPAMNQRVTAVCSGLCLQGPDLPAGGGVAGWMHLLLYLQERTDWIL